jgi:hypothetical protein
MVLSIQIIENMSVTLPILQVLDPNSNQFLLSSDVNCSALIKSGQQFSLFSQTGSGVSQVRTGAIRSVSQTREGVIVHT